MPRMDVLWPLVTVVVGEGDPPTGRMIHQDELRGSDATRPQVNQQKSRSLHYTVEFCYSTLELRLWVV